MKIKMPKPNQYCVTEKRNFVRNSNGVLKSDITNITSEPSEDERAFQN
jgi:hypothetical protein